MTDGVADVRRTRLLVADDDERLLTMLAGLLEDLGYDVAATAPDGRSAVDRCLSDPPDVAILDQRMPGLSGIDAAKELKQRLPQLPIVILSAYDDPGLQEAALQAGVATYLVKGCSAAEIAAVIDRASSR